MIFGCLMKLAMRFILKNLSTNKVSKLLFLNFILESDDTNRANISKITMIKNISSSKSLTYLNESMSLTN